MAYRDPEIGRALGRERFRRRVAERRAKGLCVRCGKHAPEPGRTVCAPCAEKRNRASRARDARLRTAGKPRRDPEKAKAYERERTRRRAAERLAAGLCAKCGKAPAPPDGRLCGACAEKRRAAERARYAEARAAGKLYGGRDPEPKRRGARGNSRKRRHARRDAGLCTRCGRRPPAPRRGRNDLRAVPGGASGGRPGAVRLAEGGRTLRPLRGGMIANLFPRWRSNGTESSMSLARRPDKEDKIPGIQ